MEAESPELRELLRELGQGRLDSQGTFTLDIRRTLEKLARFQLETPRDLVLHVLSAALLRGCSFLRVQVHGRDLRMGFDGPPYLESELQNVFHSHFQPDPSPLNQSRAQLALAFNAANQLKVHYLVFESFRERGSRLQISEGELRVAPVLRASWRDPELTSVFHLRERHSLATLLDARAERVTLAARAALAPVPIFLNGFVLREEKDPPHAAVFLGSRPNRCPWLNAAPIQLRLPSPLDACLCLSSHRRKDVELIVRGVRYETRRTSQGSPWDRLIVYADDLPRDVSLRRLTDGPPLESCLESLRGEADRAARALLALLQGASVPPALQALARWKAA